MPKAKKLLLSILVLVISLSGLLVACSQNEEDGTSQDSSDGETNLRFSIWYGPGDIEVWEQVIENFEDANPNINVEFEPIEFGNYWTKLQTQLAANSAPDVIGMHVGIVYEYGDKQQLEPLDDYIRNAGLDPNVIPDPLLEEGKWPKDSPNQYALPWRFAGGPLYINKTAFEEAGIPYPENGWTIQEFVDAARKLTTNDRYGLLVPTTTMSASLMGAFSASTLSEDRLSGNYDSPEVLEYYEWMHNLVYQEKVAMRPDQVDEAVDPFASGQVAMTFAGSWMIPVYRDIEDFDWDIAPMPTLNGNSKTYAGPDMISITKDSKNKEAAWKFVEYTIFNEEAQELLGTTGLPILEEDLTDEELIKEVAEKKPEHYKIFLDGAINNGIGYNFTTKFFEINTLEGDADYLIYSDKNADIKKILEDLNEQIDQEFSR